MNAHTPSDLVHGLTQAAINNGPVLRALSDHGPLPGHLDVAEKAGLPSKNMLRALDALAKDGFAEQLPEGGGWAITDAGRRALLALWVAAGVAEVGAPAPDPDGVLLLRHDQMRPNPLQPRKHFDRQELDELKASIVAAGDVLQNLVVFPADADGVHTISAGERRWRAVGELIAEGAWPEARRLRALQRENTDGQTAFIALVENGQRSNLTMMEQARAYEALARDTGLSARACALQTGRDPRTVQEMLKVLREASADDIAAHEAGEPGKTWEWLRDTVKERREAEAGGAAEAVQGDVEDVAKLPYELDEHNRRNLAYHATNCAKLTARERLMLVELADKVLRDPIPGRRLATLVTNDHSGTSTNFILAGAGFASRGGKATEATIAASSLEWLRTQGLLTVIGDRTATLRRARQEAGVALIKVVAAEDNDRYITPWLNLAPSNEDAMKAAPIIAGGGGTTSGQPPKPPRAAAGPDTELSPVQRLALVELAYKLQGEAENGWTPVRKYWLDTAASDLAADLFVAFSHRVLPGGPHGWVTEAGYAWLAAHGYPRGGVTENQVGDARRAVNPDPIPEGTFATPWLNVDDAPAPERRGLQALLDEDLPDVRERAGIDQPDEFDAADTILKAVVRQIDSQDGVVDLVGQLAAAGVSFPLRLDPEDRAICGADGEPILDLVGHGDTAGTLLLARGLLLATALNTLAEWAHREPLADQPAAKTDAEPKVPIRRSITPDTIVCLEDGRKLSAIGPYLRATYGLTPDGYRTKWGLPRDYPMVAPNVSRDAHVAMRALGIDVDATTAWADDDDGAEA